MRWRVEEAPASPAGSVLRRWVAQVEQYSGRASPLKDGDLDAMADALTQVLEERGLRHLEVPRVLELSARTLGHLGADDLARRLLVFGGGLVTPAVWEISGGDALWILDLRRLAVDSGVQVELAFFRALGAVVEAVADVWDRSGGRGCLALRHVRPTAERLLGTTGRGRRRPPLGDEILEHCRAALEQQAARRAWAHVPDVLDLG